MQRRLVFDLRYSADTVRDISNRYLEALDPHRYRCETVILKGERDTALEAAIPAQAFHWMNLNRAALSGNRRTAVKRFTALCHQQQPDLVIAHRFKAVAIMAQARTDCRFLGYGVIHGIHQMDRIGRRLFAHRHLRDPVHLIGVSEAVTRDLRRVCGPHKRNLHTLLNCIDDAAIRAHLLDRSRARELLGLPDAAPVIGSIARLVPTKDLYTLIDAFARLSVRVPACHLCLIGDGPSRGDLERQARDLGLADRVHFAGWRNDACHLLAALDVFALTSVAEGFGLSLAEAMAAGVPVVATSAGGMGEVTGDLAPLAPPGDAAAVALSLERLLSLNAIDRAQLSERLRHRIASRFSPAVFHEQLNALLERTGGEAISD